MKNTLRLWIILLFALSTVVYLGCGGSKETVNIPPPRIEQEPEEPPASTGVEPETEVKKSPSEDIVIKKPVALEMIHFDFDRSELTGEARSIMARNAEKLADNPRLNIRIEGHCDERGTVEYNLALGERRAQTARSYLVNYGISPGRISIISYGKERPLDLRHTPEAWDMNRRAEFIILNQ